MGIFGEFIVVLLFAGLAGWIANRAARVRWTQHGLPQKASTLFLGKRAADIAFSALFLAYVLVFAALSVLRLESLHSGWDLAVQDQTIWNSLHGRLWIDTIHGVQNFLGIHFSPLLLALVPLYAVWGDVRVLLITQTVILAATAVPLYWFARKQLGDTLATIVALSFFLSPAVQYVNLDDFHEISLAMPLLGLAIFFLLSRRYLPFLFCILLALLAKEEVALVLVAFGAFIFLVQRKYLLGLAIALFGGVSFVVLLFYVIPAFSSGAYLFQTEYASLGNSIPEIVTNILLHPDKIWAVLSNPGRLEFILLLLVPLGLMPIAGIEITLMAIPVLAGLLLADRPIMFSIRHHYTTTLIPFLYFGAAVGMRRLLDWSSCRTSRSVSSRQIRKRCWELGLSVFLLVAGCASYYLYAPGPLARSFTPSTFAMDARARAGRRLVSQVPRDAVVVVQKELLAHFSDRKELYEIPSTDYRKADYLFAEEGWFWYEFHKGVWDAWLSTGYFEIMERTNGFIFAKRRDPENPMGIMFGDRISLIGYTSLPQGVLHGGTVLRPIVFWRAGKTISERYNVVVQVVDAQGHVWAQEDREPQDGTAPTSSWEVGKPVGDQYTLRLPPTMPAGDYQITAALHKTGDAAEDAFLEALDGQGKSLGTEAVVTAVRIEKNKDSFEASDLWWIEQPHRVDMREMRLLGYVPPRETISPGELLQVGFYWRARDKPRGDYSVAVQLRNATGQIAFEHSARPAHDTYPTTQWDVGEVLLDWHDFNLPADLAPGGYQIAVVLRDAASGAEIGEALISTISIAD